MKDKVVVFTDNNARILTNPINLSKFVDKENAVINPDLTFVTGIEPHFWKLLKRSEPISITDAYTLKMEVAESIKLVSEDSHEGIFYKTLLYKLEEEIDQCNEASNLVEKLLNRAQGIEREEITTFLTDHLTSHSDSPSRQKETSIYRDMIDTWERGTIIPMSDYEKILRTKDVKKTAPNRITKLTKQEIFWPLVLAVLTTTLTLGVIAWLAGR